MSHLAKVLVVQRKPDIPTKRRTIFNLINYGFESIGLCQTNHIHDFLSPNLPLESYFPVVECYILQACYMLSVILYAKILLTMRRSNNYSAEPNILNLYIAIIQEYFYPSFCISHMRRVSHKRLTN